MPEGHDTEPRGDARIVAYSGIFNADGGLVGEARYVLGHLLGTAECALCDITHSAIRRKPEWDRMVARVGVPVVLLHRNELDERLKAVIRNVRLPVVLAHRADGSTTVALTAEQLAGLGGSVGRFEDALRGQFPGIPRNRARIG
ncbi:hypothetical protein ACPW96_13060 [Micromonospora sp. DT81.3]|uniref:hypothetical protein n=1 Tax=Actinomycetes TaxID=1760 RepID=UPI003CEE8F64